MNSSTFSRNLYKYRVQQKLTQREIADQLNVRQQTVAAWEANRSTPAPHIICRLAQIFKITTDELLLSEEAFNKSIQPLHRLYIQELKIHPEDVQDIFSDKNILGYEQYLGKSNMQYFFIKCADDSMSPSLKRNDLILFEYTREFVDAQIFAILYQGSIILRKVNLFSDGIMLVPFNTESYECKYLQNTKINTDNKLVVLGKIMRSIRNW